MLKGCDVSSGQDFRPFGPPRRFQGDINLRVSTICFNPLNGQLAVGSEQGFHLPAQARAGQRGLLVSAP